MSRKGPIGHAERSEESPSGSRLLTHSSFTSCRAVPMRYEPTAACDNDVADKGTRPTASRGIEVKAALRGPRLCCHGYDESILRGLRRRNILVSKTTFGG